MFGILSQFKRPDHGIRLSAAFQPFSHLVDSHKVALRTEPVRKTGGEGITEHLQGPLADELDAAKQEISKLQQARVADQQMITDLGTKRSY